jgi:Cu+-exporting ATPase
MHPQIVRNEPGSCPICGMALELMTPAAGDAANPELRDMTRRFWVCVALSIPLVGLAMAGDFFKLSLLAPRAEVWVQLLLATPAVLWGGWPFFRRGWASIVKRRLNMFTLIALGTGVAYVYSLVAALMPGVFPPSFRTPEGEVPVYFEPTAVIVTLVLLGQVLELRARAQTSGAIRALLDLAPTCCVTTDRRLTSISTRSFPATGCASAPGRRCRSTVSCSKGRAPSTNL